MTDGLWPGAEVRWNGPARRRGGVRLRPGGRAIVVDPGRHGVTSFSFTTYAVRHRPRFASLARLGRRLRLGVVIQIADGPAVSVPRRHLRLVAPDHPLVPEPDGAHADWWLDELSPWGDDGIRVASFVPSAFPAVGQVLHPWWGGDPEDGSTQTWREVAQRLGFASPRAFDQTREMFDIPAAAEAGMSSSQGELDERTARALVEVLASATATPDDVFVAVWEGWGDVPVQRFPGAARLDTEARGHVLLRGPLDGVLTSVAVSPFGRPVAGLWWPADRAWFVATEVDLAWTFVAGSDDLLDRLTATPGLEVVRTSSDAPANEVAEA